MAAYCTLTDLQARIPARAGQTSFQPLTDPQAQSILDGIGAAIDGKLAGWGFAAPVTTPATAVSYLAAVNLWGAASETLKAMFRSASGPNSEAAWSFYEKRYTDAMDGLKEWAEGVLGTSSAVTPSSYTTKYPDRDVSLGANADPVLGVRMEW